MSRAGECAHSAVMSAMAAEAEQRRVACFEQAKMCRRVSRSKSANARTRASARHEARCMKAQVPLYRRLVLAFSAVG